VINPNNITLYYNTFEEVGTTQQVNVWAAVYQQAINAFKLKDLELSAFLPGHMPLWFILTNSMNNILQAVSNSTEGILDDTKLLSNDNKSILVILLLVASGCLLASMFIIMPVVTKVHQDKDKLLSLFLQIDQDDVKEQLKHCREFFTNFHNDEKGVGGAGKGAGAGSGHADQQGFDISDDEKNASGEDDTPRDDGADAVGADGGKDRGKEQSKSGQSPDAKKDGSSQEQREYKSKFQRKNKKLMIL
jgi:hypothetical protein